MTEKFDPDVLMAAIEKLAPDIQEKFKSGQKIDAEMLRELSSLAPALVEYLAGISEPAIEAQAVVASVDEIQRDNSEYITKVALHFPHEKNLTTFASTNWSFEYAGRPHHQMNDILIISISPFRPISS